MRPWLISVAALGLAVALAPLAKSRGLARGPGPGGIPALTIAPVAASASTPPDAGAGYPSLAGLDLNRIGLDDEGATAPAEGHRVALLTLDPGLQAVAWSILAAYRLPEAAIVMLDPETGETLAYASHVEHGDPQDLCAEATAPAASVFKIVTASALIETAGLSPDTRQCYAGGEQRIVSSDLVDDPLRDRWCVTLAGAMGRSINAVFARLAQKHLSPGVLEETARSLGFGESIPFDVAVAPSAIVVPREGLGFARTAAGFWNTTLSPMHAVWISAAISRGGESVRPFIVREIKAPDGSSIRVTPTKVLRRVVTTAAAEALTTMLEHTVSEGTSFRAFHDARGASFLPNITVAGKTGTLSDDRAHLFYTWFTGFAPSHPTEGVRQVAIAVLVVNNPAWRVKANVVAREMLQAYFASRKALGVSFPKIEKIASAEP